MSFENIPNEALQQKPTAQELLTQIAEAEQTVVQFEDEHKHILDDIDHQIHNLIAQKSIIEHSKKSLLSGIQELRFTLIDTIARGDKTLDPLYANLLTEFGGNTQLAGIYKEKIDTLNELLTNDKYFLIFDNWGVNLGESDGSRITDFHRERYSSGYKIKIGVNRCARINRRHTDSDVDKPFVTNSVSTPEDPLELEIDLNDTREINPESISVWNRSTLSQTVITGKERIIEFVTEETEELAKYLTGQEDIREWHPGRGISLALYSACKNFGIELPKRPELEDKLNTIRTMLFNKAEYALFSTLDRGYADISTKNLGLLMAAFETSQEEVGELFNKVKDKVVATFPQDDVDYSLELIKVHIREGLGLNIE